MKRGSSGRLYILAFDHRGSFRKKMFGITGRKPTPEENARIQDAKHLIWEGVQQALEAGVPRGEVGVLVDEEMGESVAREAKQAGVRLAMPVEKSGQDSFDFEYGQAFGEHIEKFDPEFAKVLVRWNPDDALDVKQVQGARLRKLSDWLRGVGRKYLFELLVPATESQLALVGGDGDAFDSEVRPYLMLKAIQEIRDAGVEPHIWKIEGLDRRRDCELVAGLIRSGGRDTVAAVVLGRGADDAKVDHWLSMGAPVAGYTGFAIGRTIWWNGVEAFKQGTMSREQAAAEIAGKYRHFIATYERSTWDV